MGHKVFHNAPSVEAPEGGWGYVIMLTISFTLFVTISYMACLGLMYADFLAQLGLHTKALTALPSGFFICLSFVGIFSNYLFQRFSVRIVGVLGAIGFCSGSMMIVFVQSFNQLFIAYSVVQGIGCGLVMPAMYTTFMLYFVKRRVMIMSMIGAIQCMAAVGLPVMIERLMHEFGFRGCMAILAALNLHVLLGMIALHPVEWHQKRRSGGELRRKVSEPMVEEETDQLLDVPSVITAEKKTVWMTIVDFLDLSLFLNPVYTNICIGMSIAFCSDIAFVTIYPSFLRHISFSKMDAAQILAFGSFADFASRMCVSVLSSCVRVPARALYLVGIICSVGAIVAVLHVTSFVGVSVVTALLGLFRAWFHIPITIVYADFLPVERFPSGYGLYVLAQGVLICAVAPLFGWVRDASNSFVVTFYLLAGVMATCALSWSLEMGILHWRNERSMRRRVVDGDFEPNAATEVI